MFNDPHYVFQPHKNEDISPKRRRRKRGNPKWWQAFPNRGRPKTREVTPLQCLVKLKWEYVSGKFKCFFRSCAQVWNEICPYKLTIQLQTWPVRCATVFFLRWRRHGKRQLHFGLICFQKLILRRCNGWRQRGAQEKDVNTCKVWKNGLTSGRAGAGNSHQSSTKKLFLRRSRVVSSALASVSAVLRP